MSGYFFSDRINIKKWQETTGFAILQIDLNLLGFIGELSELQILKKRNDLINNIAYLP